MTIRLLILGLLTAFAASAACAQDSTATVNYRPNVHGTVRAKYEYEPETNKGRFQVRNARVSLDGRVTNWAAYKAEIDLSDEGSMKMLDAFVKLDPWKNFNFTIGQMRVPFSIDAQRSPHSQYFANRSFIAKQVGNVRDVGAMLGYTFLPDSHPIILQAGLFNGSGLTKQKEWHSTMNYSTKAQFLPVNGLNITIGAQQICPDSVKVHLWDIGSYYEFCGFHIEAEYIFKHYEKDAFNDVHAVNAFINYDLPLKKVFQKISFLARYDYMGNHSDATEAETIGYNTDGSPIRRLTLTDHERHRATAGVTLSLAKPFRSDIRLNYEKYFYNDLAVPNENQLDKIVLELMVRF